jgi:ATP-dependent DNA helicase RecQ
MAAALMPASTTARGATLDDARGVLHASFGYPDFRPGQERAVDAVLGGRDAVVIMPTGGGKSLCYQVPALVLPGLTVVVSPLISLMKDQVDALTARGLPAAFVNSTLTGSQANERFQRAGRGELKLLYVAPERFDFGNTAERLRDIGVSLLAIDEAHCISEWGHDFRPSYLRMRAVRERLGDPTTVALTATATPDVRKDIELQLALRDPERIVTGFDRKNLHYHVVPVKNDAEKDHALVETLARTPGQAIVYAATRKNVERVTTVLSRAKIPVAAVPRGPRRRAPARGAGRVHEGGGAGHRRDERLRHGIDKANVRVVVHHAMPGRWRRTTRRPGARDATARTARSSCCTRFPTASPTSSSSRAPTPTARSSNRSTTGSGATRSLGDGRLRARDLAGVLPGKVSQREVESAVRVLGTAGAVRNEQESPSRVFVRLLATPDRIKRELTDPMELELLRAVWRAGGKGLERGTVIDLDALPSGFGGGQGALPVLEELQSRQFVQVERAGGGLRVVDRRRSLADYAVDWTGIDRRRRGETGKLDAVQKYAYHAGCRRQFVLRYFGDPAAARASCEGCDNCLGVKHEFQTPAPSSAPRSRTPGAAGGRTRGSSGAAGGARVSADPTELVLSAADERLFATLKSLRGEIARAESMPAYIVFPDRTLAELAVRRPRTLAALGEVRGVGPAKLEKYGPRFLEALRGAEQGDAA